MKIRMKDACIAKIYTIDDFLKYCNIHPQVSPSIVVQ